MEKQNIFRFIVGIASSLVLLVVVGILLLIFSPLIFGSVIIIIILIILFGGLASILYTLAFIWYFVRKEPEEGKNKSFSISQGKRK